MLGLSLKSTENVNLRDLISTYISDNYSPEDAASVDGQLQEVSKQRQKIIALTNATEDMDFAKCVAEYEKYFKMLSVLEDRFPFGKKSFSFPGFVSKPKVVSAKFTWTSAFVKKVQVSSYESAFEKRNVQFNIAALISRHGTHHKLKPEGLVEAAKCFRQAAGVLQAMQESGDLIDPSNTLPDISAPFCGAMSMFMLAQAQACTFEKAVSANMSAGMIAKLASGTAELFQKAHDQTEACSTDAKVGLYGSGYPWLVHMKFQRLCFQAASFYWMAKAKLAEDEYGVEIALLNASLALAAEAKGWKPGLLVNLTQNRDHLEQTIRARLGEARHDNELVYHFEVPRGCEPIPPMVTVKVLPYEEQKDDGSFTKAFAKLLPVEIRDGAMALQDSLQQSVTVLEQKRKEDHDYAVAHLESMNLPASLEALQSEGISDELWTKIAEVQYKGGLDALLAQIKNKRDIQQQVNDMMASVETDLKKESTEDGAMSARFGARWNRRPSNQITAGFNKELEVLRGFLSAAQTADIKIESELNANVTSLQLLSEDRASLESKIPAKATSTTPNPAADALSTLLDELSTHLAKRQAALTTLQEQVEALDCKAIFFKEHKDHSAADILAAEKKKLMDEKSLEGLALAEEALLTKITSSNEAFLASKTGGSAAQAREDFIGRLNKAATLVTTANLNVQEGIKFYGDLMREKLLPLRQSVNDFVLARDMEKKMILEQLTQNIGNQYNSAQPPMQQHQQVQSGMQPVHPQAQPVQQPVMAKQNSFQRMQAKALGKNQTVHNDHHGYHTPIQPKPPVHGHAPNPSEMERQLSNQQDKIAQLERQLSNQSQGQGQPLTYAQPHAHNPNMYQPATNPAYNLNAQPSAPQQYQQPETYGNPFQQPQPTGKACGACTFVNTSGEKKCAMCGCEL